MSKPITIAIVGLGSRGRDVYAAAIEKTNGRAVITAVADPRDDRRKEAMQTFRLPAEHCFETAEDLFSRPKLADAVLVCTQDRQHVPHALMALQQGYDVMMEKPISPDSEACLALLAKAQETGKKVVVCHVLRYAPFYRKVKEVLSSGMLGELQSVFACEDVGYWHQAHSFVRGNWRSSEETSPMLLAKCCHDMDLMVWLTGRRCKKVSSFGSLGHFTPEHAPENSALRCLDGCKAKETCPYDCEKIYLTNKGTGILQGNTGWPANVVAVNPTEENIYAALREGPYGRCVYHCDNNVVDHQVVNLEMDGGLTVSFSMSAFNDGGRYAKFMGTHGYMIADLTENTVKVMPFGEEPIVHDFNQIKSQMLGHAGGDTVLVREFLDFLQGADPKGITSLETSMESHFICFAAEESRLAGGVPVELCKYRP